MTLETPPTLELGPNINLCPGESEILDAGAGYDTYVWSTGANSQTITINQPGDYYVTVTYHGCTLDDAMNIGDDCLGEIFIERVRRTAMAWTSSRSPT
ncbi:MAG: hypothetical protein U0176_10075 [Bacteroidia bacterium]